MPRAGIEPARGLPSSVFETDASTSSATPAYKAASIAGLLARSIIKWVAKSIIIVVGKPLGELTLMMHRKWGLLGLGLLLIPISVYGVDTNPPPTFFSFLTSPTIVYILLLIGVYGLFFELANAGLVVPGLIGLTCMLLAMYAFQLIPINYTGLVLILIGFALMAGEVYLFSYGVLGLVGVITLIVGSVMLFDVPGANNQLNWPLVFCMSTVTIIFFGMVMMIAMQSHNKAVTTGKEALIGSEGTVIQVTKDHTIARVQGEMWEVTSPSSLKVGDEIKVTNINELTLAVKKTSKE